MFRRNQKLMETIHANQLVMLAKLDAILKREATMAVDVSKIQADVAAQTTVTQSAVALLQQLTDALKNIPPSTDPQTQAAIDALAQSIEANTASLADAITKNTPTPFGS